MASILVDHLSGGVDRSRPRYVGPPGTLWSGINGHISRGGDFEKRKAFAAYASLPPNTFGLGVTQNGGLYVAGSAAAPAMPAGVTYAQLAHPTDHTQSMTAIKSIDRYNGAIYAIAQYTNSDLRHFYGGVNVANWGVGGNNPAGYGSIVRTHRRKVYSPIASLLWFSELDAPTVFDITQSGSGFVNVSTQQSGSDTITALGPYQNYLAIFSRRVIQIWNMQDDDALNAPVQTLGETGTRAPKSVIAFGDVDSFYLSDSGVRSIRARNFANVAGVDDVGTPIDTLIRDWCATLSDATIEGAVSVVEPVDGRFMLAIGSKIFVFSYFPSKKISSWSWYEPGLTFTDMVTINDRLYARAGDTIYLYGGADNATYGNDYPVTCALPFLSGGKPGTFKHFKGFDIASTGSWNCKMLVDPNNEDAYETIGTLAGVTFPQMGIGVPGHCTHFAPVLTHQGDGYASVSQIAIETDGAEAKPNG